MHGGWNWIEMIMGRRRQRSASPPVVKRTGSQVTPLSKAPFLLSCHILLFQLQIIWLLKKHFLCLLSVCTSSKSDIQVAESSRGLLESEVRESIVFFCLLTETDMGCKLSSSKESQKILENYPLPVFFTFVIMVT